MNLQRAIRFLRKSPEERRTTVRFFARKGLARLPPYVPVRICLTVPPDTEIKFWWSYVSGSDFADRSLLDYWGSDLGKLRFLWRILQPGMVFFDVGAFHGLYSLIAAKKLRGTEKLVAFEPSPRERSRFQWHLRLNGLSDVRLEPFALRAQRGRVKLFIVVAGFTSMNSLVAPPIQNKVRRFRSSRSPWTNTSSRKSSAKSWIGSRAPGDIRRGRLCPHWATTTTRGLISSRTERLSRMSQKTNTPR